jgi:hypothetical protein
MNTGHRDFDKPEKWPMRRLGGSRIIIVAFYTEQFLFLFLHGLRLRSFASRSELAPVSIYCRRRSSISRDCMYCRVAHKTHRIRHILHIALPLVGRWASTGHGHRGGFNIYIYV